MGGDRAPSVVVEAALEMAGASEIVLVGPRAAMMQSMPAGRQAPTRLTLYDAPDAVPMGEQPAVSLRHRPHSSIAVGMGLLREGKAEAFVSAGNTGAVVAFALTRLGRLPGVHRPALATPFPTKDGACLLLDVGATADARPAYLLQYAQMGAAYAQHVLGVTHPRVGLLNIGSEPGKGSQLAREAYPLLEKSALDFVGNVEGNELPRGSADVVVTDGFTGNMALKIAEGAAETLVTELRALLLSKFHYKLAAAVLRPAFRSLARRLDYAEYGGAALLGVRGIVIIAHGRSNPRAIQNAVAVAERAAGSGLLERIAHACEGEERPVRDRRPEAHARRANHE
jgi:glycerol-3-phosphate acyltransferase PlsX